MEATNNEIPLDGSDGQPKWLKALMDQQHLAAETQRSCWEEQSLRLESQHASLMKAIEESREVLQAQLKSCEQNLRCAVQSPDASAPEPVWEKAFEQPRPPQQEAPLLPQGDTNCREAVSTLPDAVEVAVKAMALDEGQDKQLTPLNVPETAPQHFRGQLNGGVQPKLGGPLMAALAVTSEDAPSGLQRFAGKIKASDGSTSEASEGSASEGLQGSTGSTSGSLSKKLWLLHNGQEEEDLGGVRQQLVRFVNGPFDVIMVFVIFLNACCMFVQTEWQGAQAGRSLGQAPTSHTWPDGASATFGTINTLFTAMYTLEIVVRMSVLRLSFFWDLHKGFSFANMFDLLLVLIAYLDYIVLASTDARNLGVLRFLRMAKLARTLRLVRVLNAFHQLRLLCCAIAASLPAFLWSMVILCVLNVIAGMILTQVLNEYVMDQDNDHATREWVNDNYGSGVKASYTMFMATHSGCWPNYASTLVDKVHPAFAIFWIVYVGAVIFAIIKIITAVFIGETMKAAQSDAVTAVTERMKASDEYIRKLKDVFECADVSGDGVLSKAEFRGMLMVPTIKHYLSILDIEVHDAEGLFDLLDDGDGQVTLSEFVSGITRMKGQARSADMVSLMYDNKITHEQGKEALRILLRMEASATGRQAKVPSAIRRNLTIV